MKTPGRLQLTIANADMGAVRSCRKTSFSTGKGKGKGAVVVDAVLLGKTVADGQDLEANALERAC